MDFKATAKRSREEIDRESIDLCLACPLPDCLPADSGLCPANRKSELDLSEVSRVAVARAVFVCPEHISGIFTGRTNCSLPLAYDIAKYLNTTIDYLYQAISGANGGNPNREKHNRFRPKATWKSFVPVPPKYSVDGKGYLNLRLALQACGVERQAPTHYGKLSADLKERIIRNRPTKLAPPVKPVIVKTVISRTCLNCGITFQTSNPQRIYHNTQCARRANDLRSFARLKESRRSKRHSVQSSCPGCGSVFLQEMPPPLGGKGRIYCTDRCRQTSEYQRRKARIARNRPYRGR